MPTEAAPLPDVARNTFTFSDAEAQRMRRGAWLIPLLVLPFVLVLGLDESKSQPTHFLIILGIGTLVSAVLVAIARAGAIAQIQAAQNTTLQVLADRLTWTSPAGRTDLMLHSISAVRVAMRFGTVRSITLHSAHAPPTTLQGYERMDQLLAILRQHLQPEVFRMRR